MWRTSQELKLWACLLLFGFILAAPFTRADEALTDSQKIKTLEQLGYYPDVAEKIVRYRPDIYDLIQLATAGDDESLRRNYLTYFKKPADPEDVSKVLTMKADASPVTVYRGIGVGVERFVPTYGGMQRDFLMTSNIYASESERIAINYGRVGGDNKFDRRAIANNQKLEGIVLEMQFPQFMFHRSAASGNGAILEPVVPDLGVFGHRVGKFERGPSASSNVDWIPYDEAFKDQLKQIKAFQKPARSPSYFKACLLNQLKGLFFK